MSAQTTLRLGFLSSFILEVLPWALSGLIGLYLLFGAGASPQPARADVTSVTVPAALPAPAAAPQGARAEHTVFAAKRVAAAVNPALADGRPVRQPM